MERAGQSVIGLLFVFSAIIKGVPALRHDWSWYRTDAGLAAAISYSMSAWSANGIGEPTVFIFGYPIHVAMDVLTAVTQPFGSFLIALCLTVWFAAYVSREIACSFGARWHGTLFCNAFLLFNPWTYTELVAGHFSMIVAYLASAAALVELLRERPRGTRLAWICVPLSLQLQFLIVTGAVIGVYAIVRREVRVYVTLGFMLLPVLSSIVLWSKSLSAIPYTLDWESSQSIDFWHGVVLNGYFTNYVAHAQGVFWFASVVISSIAVIGVAASRRNSALMSIAAGGFLMLLYTTGTRGAFEAEFRFIVAHVKVSGLFRELYDLLGYVAIALCLFACKAGTLSRYLRWSVVAAAFVGVSYWFVYPPSTFWVATSSLPRITVAEAANSRFVLLPPLQPYSYAGSGSGADPDAVPRPGNVTPLNMYVPTFPVDAALSRFSFFGNAGDVEALGVEDAIPRPGLASNLDVLAEQQTEPKSILRHTVAPHFDPSKAMPLLSLADEPAIASLASCLACSNIRFDDASRARGGSVPAAWREAGQLYAVSVPNEFVDDSQGWVDARLGFLQHPEIGQAIGGATTRSGAMLRLPMAGARLLVSVRGSLFAESGRRIAHDVAPFGWIDRRAAASVFCRGFCTVVATGDPPSAALNPAARSYRKAELRSITPWLALAHVTTAKAVTLRLNVRYEPTWTAFAEGRPLSHVRLDSVFNGWLVPPRTNDAVVLIELTSALAVLFECCGFVWIAVLAWTQFRASRRFTV